MTKAVTPHQDQLRKKRRCWLKHLNAWQKSGLTQAEYCRRHNLSPKCFTYWNRKSKKQPLQAQLAPVPVFAESTANADRNNKAALTIEFNRRYTIAVHDGFSPLTLTQLLSVLKAC